MPEDQPGRMIVDRLDGLVQLGEGAPAVNRKRLKFLQTRIGKLIKPDRDLVGILVEIVGKLAD